MSRQILRTVTAAALAAAMGTVPAAHGETAKAVPARGTVTGSLVVDGKAFVLKTAVAALQPNPIEKSQNFFQVFLSPAPVIVDPRSPQTTAEKLTETMATGIEMSFTYMAGTLHCLTFVFRDPSLGDHRLVKTGSAVCAGGGVTMVESDRIDGTVTSSADGKEETVSGHQVSYTLHFSAPFVK